MVVLDRSILGSEWLDVECVGSSRPLAPGHPEVTHCQIEQLNKSPGVPSIHYEIQKLSSR